MAGKNRACIIIGILSRWLWAVIPLCTWVSEHRWRKKKKTSDRHLGAKARVIQIWLSVYRLLKPTSQKNKKKKNGLTEVTHGIETHPEILTLSLHNRRRLYFRRQRTINMIFTRTGFAFRVYNKSFASFYLHHGIKWRSAYGSVANKYYSSVMWGFHLHDDCSCITLFEFLHSQGRFLLFNL